MLMVLVLRAHYTLDVVAGAFAAFLAANVAEQVVSHGGRVVAMRDGETSNIERPTSNVSSSGRIVACALFIPRLTECGSRGRPMSTVEAAGETGGIRVLEVQ